MNNNALLKNFLQIILFSVLFNGFLCAQQKKKKNDKIDIKALISNNTKSLIFGSIGLAALIAFVVYKSSKSSKNSGGKENKRDENTFTKCPVKTQIIENDHINLTQRIQNIAKDIINKVPKISILNIDNQVSDCLESNSDAIEESNLNDLIACTFDLGLFNSLAFLLKKNNSYIDAIQNQIILSEILNLYEKDFENIWLAKCLTKFVVANVRVNSTDFKKLHTIFKDVDFTRDNFLYYHYAQRHGWKALYDMLVEVDVIKKNGLEKTIQLQQLLKYVSINSNIYTLIQEELKKELKLTGQFLFHLLENNKKQEFVDCIKDLKQRNIHPLDVVEKNTGKTILHYIFEKKSFCTDEKIFQLIFSENNKEDFIWHHNITLANKVDNKDNKTIINYCCDDIPFLINFFAKFGDQHASEIRNFLEKNNNFEYILNLSGNDLEGIYRLLSYGIDVNQYAGFFEKFPANIWNNTHIDCLHIHYEKLHKKTKEILISNIKSKKLKEYSTFTNFFDLNGIFDQSIEMCVTKILQLCSETAQIFIHFIFNALISDQNNIEVHEQIQNILRHFTQKNIKNSSLLFDLFESYLCTEGGKEFKKEILEVAYRAQNNEIIRKLILEDYILDDLIGKKNHVVASLKNKSEKSDSHFVELYILLLSSIFKQYDQETNEYKQTIEEIKTLMDRGYEQELPDLYFSLLLFLKEQNVLKKIYPKFHIITWFSDREKWQNEAWRDALKKFWHDEFILWIKNPQLSLFTSETVVKYMEYLTTLEGLLDITEKSKNLLHHAFIENNKDMADLLINACSDFVLQKDELGNTPLHYAKDIGILINLGLDAYIHKQEIFDLKNWYGDTPFSCFFKQLSNERFEEIFKEDIFQIARNNNRPFLEKYQSALWLALFKESLILVATDLEKWNILHDCCTKCIKYIDAHGFIYIFDNRGNEYVKYDDLFKMIKEKKFLTSEEKNKIINYAVNNKNPIYFEKLMQNSRTLCYNYICGGEEINWLDVLIASLETHFNTHLLVEFCAVDWKRQEFLSKRDSLIRKLIEKNDTFILGFFLNDSEKFLLSTDELRMYAQYAIALDKFEIADYFSYKKNVFDMDCVEKSIMKDSENAEKYLINNLVNQLFGGIDTDLEKPVNSYLDDGGNTLLHIYNLPVTHFEKRMNFLWILLESYKLNPFIKNNKGVPAIIKLCSKIEYRHFIDWWMNNKIRNDKNSFIKKLRNDSVVVYKNDDISDASLLFYFGTMCRLTRTVQNLTEEIKEVGVNTNDLRNSTNKLAALFYKELHGEYDDVQIPLDPQVHHPNRLCDPLFGITPAQNARIFNDTQKDSLIKL